MARVKEYVILTGRANMTMDQFKGIVEQEETELTSTATSIEDGNQESSPSYFETITNSSFFEELKKLASGEFMEDLSDDITELKDSTRDLFSKGLSQCIAYQNYSAEDEASANDAALVLITTAPESLDISRKLESIPEEKIADILPNEKASLKSGKKKNKMKH